MGRNYCQEAKGEEDVKDFSDDGVMKRGLIGVDQNIVGSLRRPKAKAKEAGKDRRVPVPWEVSVRYMDSQMYKQTYSNYKVWQLYRRSFRGQFYRIPLLTRLTCIGEDGFIQRASPCPICRDKYLILHYKNVKLLEQFLNSWNGDVLEMRKTGLCQVKHEELLIALYHAKNYGTLPFEVPHRVYDYRNYYDAEKLGGIPQIGDHETDEVNLVMERIEGVPEYGGHHDYALDNHP